MFYNRNPQASAGIALRHTDFAIPEVLSLYTYRGWRGQFRHTAAGLGTPSMRAEVYRFLRERDALSSTARHAAIGLVVVMSTGRWRSSQAVSGGGRLLLLARVQHPTS